MESAHFFSQPKFCQLQKNTVVSSHSRARVKTSYCNRHFRPPHTYNRPPLACGPVRPIACHHLFLPAKVVFSFRVRTCVVTSCRHCTHLYGQMLRGSRSSSSLGMKKFSGML